MCLVQAGVHQGSVLSLLLFAVTVDVISKNVTEALMNKILYADYLILISKNI